MAVLTKSLPPFSYYFFSFISKTFSPCVPFSAFSYPQSLFFH